MNPFFSAIFTLILMIIVKDKNPDSLDAALSGLPPRWGFQENVSIFIFYLPC